MNRIVVTGTGTHIGKTHVTCALARACATRKRRVAAFKPIESGVEPGNLETTDAAALANASTPELRRWGSPVYTLREPLSPHLAARRANITLSLAPVLSALQQFDEQSIDVSCSSSPAVSSPRSATTRTTPTSSSASRRNSTPPRPPRHRPARPPPRPRSPGRPPRHRRHHPRRLRRTRPPRRHRPRSPRDPRRLHGHERRRAHPRHRRPRPYDHPPRLHRHPRHRPSSAPRPRPPPPLKSSPSSVEPRPVVWRQTHPRAAGGTGRQGTDR